MASPLSVHPPAPLRRMQQSGSSSKCRFRGGEKKNKERENGKVSYHKCMRIFFRNTLNVRSKLQQPPRDFTDVFRIEGKKNPIPAPAAGSRKLFIPPGSSATPKVTKQKTFTSQTTTETFPGLILAPKTACPPSAGNLCQGWSCPCSKNSPGGSKAMGHCGSSSLGRPGAGFWIHIGDAPCKASGR